MTYCNHAEAYFEEWSSHLSKKGWLDYLYNTYGEFKLAFASLDKDGNPFWSKHHPYQEIRDDQRFIECANNRTILESELVLDLEQPDQLIPTIAKLHEENVYTYSVFKTGSRGYHIHIFNPVFQESINPKARKLKEHIIRKIGADPAKASNKAMIALEFAPHWKTGKTKEYVENGV